MYKDALIVFAKNPELGKVKTRLAQSIGDEEALAVYKKLIAHTQRETAGVQAALLVYYSSAIGTDDGWKHFEKKLQTDGDLGRRMSAAIKTELQQCDKVCIVGTDCAELTNEHIKEAFGQLNHHDFVIGPANDGGYYLLGMKSFESKLFDDIDWSTDQVLKQTVHQIKELGKSYFLLPELIDVDTIEDWQQVQANFE